MIGLSLVPGPVWPVARCSVALGPRHGPRSLPSYRKIAGSTRNPSRINCSTRCRLPPVAAVRTRWERRAFGFIELERAGDGVQDFVCYSGGLASFQAGVVLDADPGEHRHFLMAQALDPALAPLAEVRETRLPGADPRSA